MKHSRFLVMVMCLWASLGLAALGLAQGFWAKTPFQRWSKQDALQVITDSPWAQTDVLTGEDLLSEDLRARFKLTKNRYSKDSYINIINLTHVRLRSALPLRQAFVRQKQISIKYEKLGAAEKMAFDADVKEFLECAPCAKYYIVTVESGFLTYLHRKAPDIYSPDLFQGRAYLANDKGQWRPCVHVRQENQEILFFFQRMGDDGKSLITPDNKTFLFTLDGEVLDGKFEAATSWEFKVSKLALKGEIVF